MDLNQVTVPCDDLAASVDFYRRLGLRLIVNDRRTTRGSSVRSAARPSPCTGHPTCRRPDGIVVYFELDELDAAVRRLAAEGLRFESEPGDQPWLWREAYLRDPAGNRICLFHAGENRRNPPWRISGQRDRPVDARPLSGEKERSPPLHGSLGLNPETR